MTSGIRTHDLRVTRAMFSQLSYEATRYRSSISRIAISLARVVQKVDNAIHRINHYPVDSMVCFVNIYPLDSDLSGG